MKIFLIILTLIAFVGGVFWAITTISDDSVELEDPLTVEYTHENAPLLKNKDGATKEYATNDKNVSQVSDDLSVKQNNELQNQDSQDKNEIIKIDLKEITNENSEILTTNKQTLKSEQAEINEEISKKSFSFVDENGISLFNGKTIKLNQSIQELDAGVSIRLSKNSENRWQISLISESYFIDESINSIFTSFQTTFEESSLAETNKIILSKFAELHIQLKYKEGVKPIPDGTECALYASYLLDERGKIKNGIAIFKIKDGGVRPAYSFSAGSHFKSFNLSLLLTRGQITTTDLELENGKDQSFKIIDSLQKPLENYLLYIFKKGANNSFNLTSIRDLFQKEGNFKNNIVFNGTEFNYFVTDKDGIGTIKLLANGEYTCFILGKNHSEQLIDIKVEDEREMLTFIMNENEKKKLTLKVKLNNEPYLKDLEYAFCDLIEFGAIHRKSKGKIIGGQIEINSLKSTKYQFQLADDNFQRDIFEIDLRENDTIEYTIDLKTSETFIHGYFKDLRGEPLKGIQVQLSPLPGYIKSNEMGYFKFGGLEKEKKYDLYIAADHPKPKGVPKGIFPTLEEINIILDDIIYIQLKVLGIDGKPAPNFSYTLNTYRDKEHKYSRLTSRNFGRNGEITLMPYDYGYYDIFITFPNMPSISKQFSVLSKEEITPITLQAIPGFTLTGTVYDCEGKSVSDVSITRSKYNGPNVTRIYEEIMKTDKDGYFKLDHCRIDEKYWFVKIGYPPIPIITTDEDKNLPRKLTFVKAYKLTGKLQSADNKPHAMIQVVANLKTNRKEEVVTETGVDGSFIVNSITPGEWYVYFNIRTQKNKKKPGQWVTITDKDEEIQVIHDIPKD